MIQQESECLIVSRLFISGVKQNQIRNVIGNHLKTNNHEKNHFSFYSLTSVFLSVYGQLGTIDPNFNLGTGFGIGILQSRVETIIQQPDEKLLVGG